MNDHDDREDRAEPSSRRLLALFHAFALGAWRLEEALRVLGERRSHRSRRSRNPLDSPSGFHHR